MPRSVIIQPSSTNFNWNGNYVDFSPEELDDVSNQNKVLVNIGGNLTWIDFSTFVDTLASHLPVLKSLNVTNAPLGSFLRKGATGSLSWTGLIDTSVLLVGSPSQVLLFTDSSFYNLSGSNFLNGKNLVTGTNDYTPEVVDMTIDTNRKGLTVPNNRYIVANSIPSPTGTSDFTIMYVVRYTGTVVDHSAISNREPNLTVHVNFLLTGNFGSYHRLTIDTGSAATDVNLSGLLTTNTLYTYFAQYSSVTKKFDVYFAEGLTGTITGPRTKSRDDVHVNGGNFNTDPLRLVNGWGYVAEPTNTILHAFGVYNSNLSLSQMNDIRSFMIANTANS